MKFKNLFILTILLIFLSAFQAFGCLQAAGIFVVGKRIPLEGVPVNEFMAKFLTHEDRAHWEKLQAKLELQKKNHPVIDTRNNLAVALIHLGRIREAIKILEEIEQKTPGGYFTAANLGTAYELSGENQKALDWIKEGIKRKKESHFGTEWLHVEILEAKLALEKDAGWLKNNSILGANFSAANRTPPKIYSTDFLGQQKSLAEIEEALVYQLHERLEFVKAPEPTVAGLLFDLSKVFAVSRTPEHSKAINELAVKYAGDSKELVKDGSVERDKISGIDNQNFFYYAVSAIALLLLAGLIHVFIKRRNLRWPDG
jgi:tetratricopeptide (TPR) repeat protein